MCRLVSVLLGRCSSPSAPFRSFISELKGLSLNVLSNIPLTDHSPLRILSLLLLLFFTARIFVSGEQMGGDNSGGGGMVDTRRICIWVV